MKGSRKAAETLAGELLGRNSPPLTPEVLLMLNLWKFKSNPYRKNVMQFDTNFVYSDCFGMSVSRTQQLSVATNSRNSNSIDQVIIRWMWAKFPKEMSKHPFTSVTINSNFSAKIHRDRNNLGLSLITSIGNYTGGNLLYWEDDDHKMSLDEVAKHEPRIVDLKDKAFLMNGQCAHAVEAFEGTRYSIILYSSSKHSKLNDKSKIALMQKGYVWPKDNEIPLIMENFYKPKGYQMMREGKEHICQTLAEMKHFVGEWLLTHKKTPWAVMARGIQRKHKVGACKSHHVLSVDLTGPFPACLGKNYTYGLVAVYSMGAGEICRLFKEQEENLVKNACMLF